MSDYTPQQIQGVLNSPNEFPPKMIADMVHQGKFTLAQLNISPAQKTFVEKQLTMLQEEEDYQDCISPEATYEQLENFLTKYPTSIHRKTIDDKLIPMREERRVYDNLILELDTPGLSFEEKFNLLSQFRVDNPFNIFNANVRSLEESLKAEKSAHDAQKQWEEEQRRKQAEAEAMRRQEQREDEEQWARVVAVLENQSYDSETKRSYLLSYDQNPKYSLHKHEVPSRLSEIDREKVIMPSIMAVINDPDSDVIDYIKLYDAYHSKRQFLKEFMIKDMRVNPSRYDRDEMIWLLKGKDSYPQIFTVEELVAANIAPMNIWNHILKHPTDADDKDPLEEDLKPETNFKSSENNTDVYFFGVPGSGKTTVLAGLFNVDRCDNLRLKLPAHGDHIGYNYASILQNYLSQSLFPQRTKTKFVLTQQLPTEPSFDSNPFAEGNDYQRMSNEVGSEIGDKFIQIVDGVLVEDNPDGVPVEHYLSLIEMPGERTLDFAAADIRDPETMDQLLGNGTKQLFMNNNRKVFFFVLDPNPFKKYDVPLNGIVTPMTQRQALAALVDFLGRVPGLLQKVDAMHIILTKSDMLRNPGSIDCIKDDVINRGYEGVVYSINELCKPSRGNVNAQCDHRAHLFTFSLGKVYPGHMIRYNKEDSAKILKVIAANTYSIRTEPTKWESIVEWMNK